MCTQYFWPTVERWGGNWFCGGQIQAPCWGCAVQLWQPSAAAQLWPSRPHILFVWLRLRSGWRQPVNEEQACPVRGEKHSPSLRQITLTSPDERVAPHLLCIHIRRLPLAADLLCLQSNFCNQGLNVLFFHGQLSFLWRQFSFEIFDLSRGGKKGILEILPSACGSVLQLTVKENERPTLTLQLKH